MKPLFYRLCLLALLTPLYGICQTPEEIIEIQKKTNVKALLEFSKNEAREYSARQQKLQVLKKLYQWPDTVVHENGKKRFLSDLDRHNKPVYTETLDSEGILNVRSDKVYTGGGLNLDLHGEGMTAAVFDVGAIATNHTAFEGRTTLIDLSSSAQDHPTGVAGQINASGAYNTPFTTPDGFYYGQAAGIAPKANVLGYFSTSDLTGAPSAAANGVLVSNHSYGDYAHQPGQPGGYYGDKAMKFDSIMNFAPYYLSVWACGNNTSNSLDRLTWNSVNKNGIAVANSDEFVTYTGPSSVTRYISSRGPSDDGRIKPDIAAPGNRVRMLSANTASTNEYWHSYGTSFAAPMVSGATLLVQQHYKNLNPQFMLASTAKAVMLHTTLEAGPAPGPDVSFGWGLLNVENAVNAISNNGGKSLILEDSLFNAGVFSKELIPSGTEPLMATIVWNDPKGVAVNDGNSTIQLINDLDVRLLSGGTTYFPWKLDSTNYNNAALQGDNIRDNIERVEISAPTPGQVYTLRITHKGNLLNGSQSFSLVVTGLEQCVVSRTITSDVNSSSTDQQQASANIVVGNTVKGGGSAIYHAADEVLFTDGFTGLTGSKLHAYLEGCTNDYNARTAVAQRSVVTYPTTQSPAENTELPESAVYPNPSNGAFKVDLRSIPSGKVEVVSLEGNRLFELPFSKQSEMEVDIKRAIPGTYVLRVISDKKILTKKIIRK